MAEEDWDKLVDQYDRGHRGKSTVSMSALDDDPDGEDAPPPPPPPPPPSHARSPSSSPSGSPSGPGPSASPGHNRGPSGTPPPLNPQQQQFQGGLAAAIAARAEKQKQEQTKASPPPVPVAASTGRRDSNPPPPPKTSPPPPLHTGASKSTLSSSPTPPPPPALTVGTPTNNNGPPPAPAGASSAAYEGRPSIMKVMGSAATGLWGFIRGGAAAATGAGAQPPNPLGEVMQELAATYKPFPAATDPNAPGAGGAGGAGGARGNNPASMAKIKVVVTTPKIKRHPSRNNTSQSFTTPSGIRSPDGPAPLASPSSLGGAAPPPLDDEAQLWSDTNQRPTDLQRVWLRFIEPKSGSVLYFNTASNSAQGDRPAAYDGSDDEDDEDDESDGDTYDRADLPSIRPHHGQGSLGGPGGSGAGLGVGGANPRRARAESIILSEAWEDSNKTGGSSSSSSSAATGSGHGAHGRNPVLSPGGSSGSIDPRLLVGVRRSISGSTGPNNGPGGVPPSPSSSSSSSLPSPPGALSLAGHHHGGAGADQEEFGPTDVLSAAAAAGAAGAPKALMSIEGFLSSSTLYSKQLEQLLEAAASAAEEKSNGANQQQQANSKVPQLSEELEAKLKALLVGLQEVQTLLDSSAGGVVGGGGPKRNDVENLVLLDKLPWDFSVTNKHVQQYRRNVAEIPHEKFAFNGWHLPAYLSTFPLPPDTKAVTIVVKLPDIVGGPTGGDANAPGGSASTTRIGVTEKDTCAAAIGMAFKKCSDKLGDRSLTVVDFVLKGNGIADFMYGEDKRIMDYEYIRMCVRNGEEVKLSLVRRPTVLPEPEAVKEFVPGYLAKVDMALPVIDPNVAYQSVTARDLKVIPMAELTHLPFRFKLVGLDNFCEASMPRFENVANLYVRIFLFYGCRNVADPRESDVVEIASDPRWFQWVVYKDLTLASVPRGARLGFILCGRKVAKPEKEIMLGWVVHQLVDENGQLSRGKLALRLWANEARKKGKHGKPREPEVSFLHRATTAENLADPPANVATLHIQLDDFCLPVVAPNSEKIREAHSRIVGVEVPLKNLTKDQLKQFEGLLACDILKELTESDQILLWNMRHHLVKNPAALGKFLQCVDWGNVEKRMEAYRLLKIWTPPASPVTALELLDAKFPDPIVRGYGIDILRQLKDDELRNYLLQLVQCLKFEPYHDSPLKRFLIERALAAPMVVGHYFFWHLKAEVHAPFCCERFGLILEEYLSFAGRFTIELRKQASAVLKLQRIAEMVVRLKRDHGYSDPDAMKEYSKECEKLNRDFFAPMGKFQLPLDPKIEVTQLVVEKCRYMSSKMVPLWLVFKNADPDAPNVYVIFKSGDDLRQDILTLQILTLMDALWLGSGLDCRMKPYKCIATGVNEHGEGVGLIEVVLNSDTTSGIQLKYGGGAMGALKMDPLDLFLREHNRIARDYDKAVDNFVCSCAGYCVATFVLGIGDRHNGNIMVTKDGHLFHIDFGHFLGNFKQKFGINRERAAFVFTPEMAFVMGGAKYRSSGLFKKFLEYCNRAFKTLRVHANLLESLFGLMVAAGMPELIKETDIYYMRDKLLLNEKESKAESKLKDEIENSLDSKYRRFDNFIHNIRHG